MRTPSNIKMQKTGAKVVFYAGGDGPLLILALAGAKVDKSPRKVDNRSRVG